MMKITSRLVQTGMALAISAALAAAAQAGGLGAPTLSAGTSPLSAPGNAFATGGTFLSLSGSGNSYTFSYSGSLGSNAGLNFVTGGGSEFPITSATVTLSGTLTRSGSNPWALSSGTETITGNIAACSSNCGSLASWGAGSGTLFKANLSSLTTFQPSGGSDYIGFKTSFAGTSSWMLTNNVNQGSLNESVYLYALTSTALSTNVANNSYFNAFVAALASGANLSSVTVNSYIGSYSTVPLPLPALLFTSGLAGLGLIARRKITAAA
jgi:hypothetical protein